MSTSELTAKVNALRELQAQIEQLTQEAEAIRDAIKGEMYRQDTEELSGPGWKATWKNVVSSRLDTKSLQAELPEIAARFTRKTVTCRFCIR